MLKEKFNDLEKDYKAFKVKIASFVVEKPTKRPHNYLQGSPNNLVFLLAWINIFLIIDTLIHIF